MIDEAVDQTPLSLPRLALPIQTGESANMMLARNPTREYVAFVTGLSAGQLDLLYTSQILHFRSRNEPETAYAAHYYQAARESTVYAANEFPLIVGSQQAFGNLIKVFSQKGSYADDQGRIVASPNLRDRSQIREVVVPGFLITGFNRILAQQRVKAIDLTGRTSVAQDDFGGFYTALYDQSTTPLEKVLDELYKTAEQAVLMSNFGARDKALSKAIEFLRTTEISWLWDRGNHSRSTNLFNALLSCVKPEGTTGASMPHGVLDLAAFCMDSTQFEAYVRFCRSIKLETK